MRNLINFEFRKLFKSKSFYISLTICILLVLLGGLTIKMIVENLDTTTDLPSKYTMLQGSINSANITLISAIFVTIFVSEDETSGILKNIYAKGYLRESVYIAKYISSLVAVLIFTFSSMFLSYMFGKFIWPESTTCINNLFLDLVAQVLLIIAYQSLFFAISLKARKTATSIAFNIIGPICISMILSIGDGILNLNNFKLSSYSIDSLLASLEQTTVNNQTIITSIIIGIVYSLIFVSVGFILNRKKEV